MTLQKAKLAVMRAVRHDQTKSLAEHMIDAGLTLQIAHAEILNHGPFTVTRGSTEVTKRLVRVKVNFRLWHAETDTHEDMVSLGEAADQEDAAVQTALERARNFALDSTFFFAPPLVLPVPEVTNETGGVRLAVVEEVNAEKK